MVPKQKSPTGKAGQILNLSNERKLSQKPLTTQEIFRRAKTQRKTILSWLQNTKKAKNMRQIELGTGIERPSLCRRISELQEDGKVSVAHYAQCPITGYPKVGFYWLTEK